MSPRRAASIRPSDAAMSAALRRSRSSTSPRGCGGPTAYGEDDFAAFREAMRASRRVKAILIHAVYLLNCASTDKEIRDKSRASLIQSLRVGDGIGAAGVVLHPGSAKQGDVGRAIKRAGKVIGEALAETERCPLHLEDTAGAGGTLGRSFAELAALLDAAGGGPRLGVCLDSCHLLASGYDIRTAEGLGETLDQFDARGGHQAPAQPASQRLADPAGLKPRPARQRRPGRARRVAAARSSCPSRALRSCPACSRPRVPSARGPPAEEIELCFKLRRRGLAARARAKGKR